MPVTVMTPPSSKNHPMHKPSATSPNGEATPKATEKRNQEPLTSIETSPKINDAAFDDPKKQRPCLMSYQVNKVDLAGVEANGVERFEPQTFLHDIAHVPWHLVSNEEDVNDALFCFMSLFTQVVDQHAPVRKSSVRSTPSQWVDGDLWELMNQRDYAKKEAQASGLFF
ncbi:hypothetical protein Bbelb_049300 [Branchiostoma belcheri]|nr:hypothetical protein Bbelb_049300 [Branchiostoma belcheri]